MVAKMGVDFSGVTSEVSSRYILEDQERMARARNYFAWQRQLVTRELGRRVVEVGCGLGNFTEMLLDRELVIAVDAEPGCTARLKQRYPDRNNLLVFTCDAGSPAFTHLAAFQPDSCVCLNVLEHIRDDAGALRSMASLLTPGGVIVLLVPAFQALYGPIDRNLGHRRRYSRRSLVQMAETAGLRVRKAHYMNFLGFFGWWTNAHLLRREAQSEGQIGIFDRYLVPILSRLEDWARPPFGQSLFVVLEKP
ncbi:MAG TPA: class I SAM-dependent methyltransferase [Bryobacteraceae bacterium]|nr:class I SAM-dependent methyltransferase [Bryobacteraceae bacterium]